MKPFNLERALVAGDKVVTRDGREVTQLHLFDAKDTTYTLIGVVGASMQAWTPEGFCLKGDTSNADLFMVPKTVKRWVNFFHSGCANAFENEDAALYHASYRDGLCAIAVPVEFEEGYGCNE